MWGLPVVAVAKWLMINVHLNVQSDIGYTSKEPVGRIDWTAGMT